MPDTAVGAPPALVRNNEKGCTVLTNMQTKDEITWQGHGDVNGEDFQYVPVTLLQTPPFLKALTKGIFTVVEADESTQKALEAQAAAWQRRQQHIEAAAESVIDRQSDRTLDQVRIDEKGNITAVPIEKDNPNRDQSKTTSEGLTESIPVIIETRQSAITQ